MLFSYFRRHCGLELQNHKELYQIIETASLEELQQQQQLKWIAHGTQRENNDIIKMLTFYKTSNKRLEKKTPSVLERAITATGFEMIL